MKDPLVLNRLVTVEDHIPPRLLPGAWGQTKLFGPKQHRWAPFTNCCGEFSQGPVGQDLPKAGLDVLMSKSSSHPVDCIIVCLSLWHQLSPCWPASPALSFTWTLERLTELGQKYRNYSRAAFYLVTNLLEQFSPNHRSQLQNQTPFPLAYKLSWSFVNLV